VLGLAEAGALPAHILIREMAGHQPKVDGAEVTSKAGESVMCLEKGMLWGAILSRRDAIGSPKASRTDRRQQLAQSLPLIKLYAIFLV
jgi:hypothetical protein